MLSRPGPVCRWCRRAAWPRGRLVCGGPRRALPGCGFYLRCVCGRSRPAMRGSFSAPRGRRGRRHAGAGGRSGGPGRLIAGYPPGVPGCWCVSGDAGEPIRSPKDGEVTSSGAEELSGKDGSEAGHAEQGLGVPVFGDLLTDQRIKASKSLSRAMISWARAATISSPMCCAGTAVSWDLAASMTAWATTADERAPIALPEGRGELRLGLPALGSRARLGI